MRRLSEGGLEFVETGNPDRAAEQILQRGFVAKAVDPLAYCSGHLTKPGVEDIENRLTGGLDDAFLTAFDEAFLEGEFFKEGDVGHGFGG